MANQSGPEPTRPFLRLARLLASRLRARILLAGIRALPPSRLRARLVALFDPNEIRKAIPWSPSRQLSVVDCLGASLRVDLNDHIGYRVLIDGAFDRGFHLFAEKLQLGPKDILLDIGANIGTECIPVAVATGCEVIAIEASKQNAALLLENARRNRTRIRCHIAAVTSPEMADTDPWLEFQINAGNTGANSIFAGWNPSAAQTETELVPTTTLDALLSPADLNRIALAKIDIEGAESFALAGAQRLIGADILLVFEHRPDATSSMALDGTRALIDMLRPRFDLFGLDTRGKPGPFDPSRTYENVLAVPKGRFGHVQRALGLPDA